MGLTIIPYQSIVNELKAGQLACARIAGAVLERETGWVYPRSSRVPRALLELMRMLDSIRTRLRLAPD
jgi:hypothetical protein